MLVVVLVICLFCAAETSSTSTNKELLQEILTSKNTLTQAHAGFLSQSGEFFALVERLESKLQELEEREAKWNETQLRMKQNAAKISKFVQLSISGARYTIAKEKILQHKGSLLEQLLVSDSPPLTTSGEIFVERDPEYFKYIMRFYLEGEISATTNTIERSAIEAEFKHYALPFTFAKSSFIPRVVAANLVDDGLAKVIKEWLPGKIFQLLYKATIDGFGTSDFHKLCDNKGPTLVVIKSNAGHLFGGYTPLYWDSSSSYKTGTDDFIFTLTNPHNIPPTKYPRNLKQVNTYSIYCHSSYGPTFGGGHDILVGNNGNLNYNNQFGFPHSYIDTTGKGKETFTGYNTFTTGEIEVFTVM